MAEGVNVLKSPTMLQSRQERTGEGIVKSNVSYILRDPHPVMKAVFC